MTLRVALYARYSTDLQSESSAEDQLTALRKMVAQRGWTEVAAFRDEGISGTALATRPGVRALMRDAGAGAFDLVLTEALDRLSRGQADMARLFELLSFHGVRLETLGSGQVSELHVGLEGTMNRLYLVELAKKTRRGLIGRVEAGFSGGGHCYGYRIVAKGVLEVDQDQARMIQRIFRDYAAGASARTIAGALNAEGVPGPRGGAWGANGILGDRRAGDGLLCQELYVGVRVFNRRRYRKHPETGRRSSVLNPTDQWIRKPAPELRIVGDDLWAAVQARQAAIAASPTPRAHAPKRVFSGLIHCGVCGGPMWLEGGKYACARRRDRATCSNRKIIRAETIERRVLDGLKAHLLSPDRIAAAVRAYHLEAEAEHAAAVRERAPIEREMAETRRRMDRTMDAYERGDYEVDQLASRLAPLRARAAELQARLDLAAAAPTIRLHPKAADYYRALAEQLGAVIADDDAGEIRDLVRAAIERIDFHPAEGLGNFALQIHGTLAALLGVSERAAQPTGCGVVVGAGIGFEPMTFRL